MAHAFDPITGVYRLICEATGVFCDTSSADPKALEGLEGYSDTPDGDRLYVARQRARAKERLVNFFGLGAEEAEDRAASVRWDLMGDGKTAARALPTKEQFEQAEAAFPELRQRARVTITADKQTFAADGVDEAVVTFQGLVAPVDGVLDGLAVQVSPADPVLRITSDVPRKFTIQALDAQHWSRAVEIEAV